MKLAVRILIGAQHAYACITTDTHRSLDVRLEPGRSAPKSLRESAAEIRADAESRIRRAELMEQAAAHLEREEVKCTGVKLP